MGRIEDLEKLKELKDSGSLTDEEFEMEKQRVLNSKVENNTSTKASKRAFTGFILGLCSIIAWFIPLFGFPVTVLGIVFSALGLNSSRKSFAVTGLVLSIIFFVITMINSIAGAVIMSNARYY